MSRVRYDIPKAVKNDTFNGLTFVVTINSVALDLTDAVVNMDLRLTVDGAIVKSFSTVASNGLTILSPATDGKFSIDRQVITVDANTYKYDVELILADGTVKTYIYGNWTIIADVTHD
jgi:hypothetical protein